MSKSKLSTGLGTLSGVYGLAYGTASALENHNYWKDYEKNTGYKANYRIRSGTAWNYGGLYPSAELSIRSKNLFKSKHKKRKRL